MCHTTYVAFKYDWRERASELCHLQNTPRKPLIEIYLKIYTENKKKSLLQIFFCENSY